MMMQISKNYEDLRLIKIVETSKIVNEICAIKISYKVSNSNLDNLQFPLKANEDPSNNKQAPKWSPKMIIIKTWNQKNLYLNIHFTSM
jgi:hypothetical protein